MEAAQFEPMGIGKILDKACRLYRENFLRFLAIVAVIKVPLLLVTIVLQRIWINAYAEADPNESNTALFLGSTLVGIFIFLIAQTLCTAALMKSVSCSYLNENISVGGAYRAISKKILTLIIVQFSHLCRIG